MVSFHLGEETFIIDILQVQEIIRRMELSRMPKAPEYVEGVINLRGSVIPVMDLRKRFGIPLPEENEQERIIVIKTADKPVGMIVDAVTEVLRLPRETIDPAPTVDSTIDTRFVSGVAKVRDKLLFLLDLKQLLLLSEKNLL
jgi:purine-binding chemotaxis protein CheW